MTTVRLFNGKDQLLKAMAFLGYEIDPNGMCFGIAHMAKQAILAGELSQFCQRIRLINDVFNFVFLNGEVNNSLTTIEERHAFVKQELEDLRGSDTDPNNEFINILAFFDGIKLYHNGYLDSHLFEPDKRPTSQDATPPFVSALVESIKLAKEGGVHLLNDPLTKISTRKELETSFENLRNRLKKIAPLQQAFAIVLSNPVHAITISYDAESDLWIVINPDTLMKNPNSLTKKWIGKEISSALSREFSFSDDKLTNISIESYVSHDPQKTKDCENELMAWLDDERKRSLQEDNLLDKTNKVDSYNVSWLWMAAYRGDLNALQSLINASKNLNVLNENGEISKYITLEQGLIDINLPNEQAMTPLYAAAHNGHKKIVEELIGAGAKVNLPNIEGVTPLYVAAHNGHKDIVQMLITAGANVNLPDKEGTTPLFIAAQNGNLEIVKLLLTQDVNKTLTFKSTADNLLSFAKNIIKKKAWLI